MFSVDTSSLEEVFSAGWGTFTLMQVLSSLLLLAVCLLLIRLLTSLVRRLLAKTALDQRAQKLVASFVRGLLYVVAALLVADSLGVPVTSLVALAGVLGLAISLAVQDILSNLAGGLVILLSQPFSLGDFITTGDGEGTVTEVTFTHTKLDTPDGQRIMLPNSKVVAGKIVNVTTRGVRRIDHAVSASYDDSIQAVRDACLRAIERTDGVLSDPAPAVVVAEYGESAIRYTMLFWVKAQDYWPARAASLENVRACFEEAGITMTYNHLNVHIVKDTTNE